MSIEKLRAENLVLCFRKCEQHLHKTNAFCDFLLPTLFKDGCTFSIIIGKAHVNPTTKKNPFRKTAGIPSGAS